MLSSLTTARCRLPSGLTARTAATVFAAALAFAAIDKWFPIEEGTGELAIIALLLPIGLVLSRRHQWFPKKGKNITPPPSPRMRPKEPEDAMKTPWRQSKKEIHAHRPDQKLEKCIKDGDLDGAEAELMKLG